MVLSGYFYFFPFFLMLLDPSHEKTHAFSALERWPELGSEADFMVQSTVSAQSRG